MKLDELKPGIKVKTADKLDPIDRMFLPESYLKPRTANQVGTYLYAYSNCSEGPNHGMFFYMIEHSDRVIAAYRINEFEPLTN